MSVIVLPLYSLLWIETIQLELYRLLTRCFFGVDLTGIGVRIIRIFIRIISIRIAAADKVNNYRKQLKEKIEHNHFKVYLSTSMRNPLPFKEPFTWRLWDCRKKTNLFTSVRVVCFAPEWRMIFLSDRSVKKTSYFTRTTWYICLRWKHPTDWKSQFHTIWTVFICTSLAMRKNVWCGLRYPKKTAHKPSVILHSYLILCTAFRFIYHSQFT